MQQFYWYNVLIKQSFINIKRAFSLNRWIYLKKEYYGVFMTDINNNNSITDLFNQWHNFRQNAWKTTPNTNVLVSGLAQIENQIAGKVPASKQEAFLQLVFTHNLWWENVGYYPLEGRHVTIDKAFRSALQYLKGGC